MKTRTVLLPAAFAGTALFAATPESAHAATAEPVAASANVLLAELHTVVADTLIGSVFLDGQMLAVNASPTTHPPGFTHRSVQLTGNTKFKQNALKHGQDTQSCSPKNANYTKSGLGKQKLVSPKH